MPRPLFESRNLIGDGLYIQPAIEEWAQEHGSGLSTQHLLRVYSRKFESLGSFSGADSGAARPVLAAL